MQLGRCLLVNTLLLVFIFQSSAISNNMTTEKELIFVHIMWRHGSRAQTRFGPNSAYTVEEWEAIGSGPGELTMRGITQHLRFGKLLRKEYMETRKFLSSSYNNREVYFLSTDFNRTIASAMANTIGMFSDKEANRQNRPSDVDWPDGFVAVPVHSNPNDRNGQFISYKNCPKYEDLENIILNSSEYCQYTNGKELKAIFQEASQKSRTEITNGIELYRLWDELRTQKEEFEDFEKRVPWATKDFIGKMEHYCQNKHHYGIFESPFFYNGLNIPYTIRKLNGGRVIVDIFKRLTAKLNCFLAKGDCELKFKYLKYFAYSCHDFTLMNVFTALQINGKITKYHPDFTAALIFELYYDKVLQRPFFQMKYHRDPSSDQLEIVTSLLIGCDDNFCPLEKLEAYAKTYGLQESYEEICGVPKLKRDLKEETKTNYPSQATFTTIDSVLRSEFF